jgi:HSP20 family molecular chaperone IbpA
MLEAIAKKLRHETAKAAAGGNPLEVTTPLTSADDSAPGIGAVDLFTDITHITVTAETRNTEAGNIHVSVADGHLFIGLGEGPRACRRDLALPVEVDEDHAYATFRNGVLDVVLPRKGQAHR